MTDRQAADGAISSWTRWPVAVSDAEAALAAAYAGARTSIYMDEQEGRRPPTLALGVIEYLQANEEKAAAVAAALVDSLDVERLRRIEEAARDVVRRTEGLTVHYTGGIPYTAGMPYLVVKPDWTDDLAAALREGRTPRP